MCLTRINKLVGRPESFLQLLSRLQNPSTSKKPASFLNRKTPTVSFAGSDAVRKNDQVEDESTKSKGKAKSELKEKSLVQEAEKTPSKTVKSPPYRSTGAQPETPKASISTSDKASQAHSSVASNKPSSDATLSKTLASVDPEAKKDAKAAVETIDNSLENPPKNLKPDSAVDIAKTDVKKKSGSAVDAAKSDVKKQSGSAVEVAKTAVMKESGSAVVEPA